MRVENRPDKLSELQENALKKLTDYVNKNDKLNKMEKGMEFSLFGTLMESFNRGVCYKIISTSELNPTEIEQTYQLINHMPNWSCYKVLNHTGSAYGLLVEVDRDYIYSVFDKIFDKDVWNDKVKKDNNNVHLAEMNRLYNDLMTLRTKQNVKKSPIVCIYCHNLTKNVRLNGISIPAYAVNLKEFASICDQAGYFFVAKGVGGEYEGQRFSPIEILNPTHKEFSDKFMSTLRYTNGNNALQIQISMITQHEIDKFTANGALNR